MNKLLDTRNDVKNFMVAGDQTLVGYTEQSDLYMNLITEELIHELLKEYDKKNLVGIADGIADSIVVIEGFCHSLGLDLENIWKFVYETPFWMLETKSADKWFEKQDRIQEILEIYTQFRSQYKQMVKEFPNLDPEIVNKGIKYISNSCAIMIKNLIIISIEYNLPIQEIWDEVARSNNSKISENGKVVKNEFGKIQKPPTYSPPDIESILKRHNLI